MLDYPALFQKENVFAIRTMFWWGNFFSITLHISGQARLEKMNLKNVLTHLREKNFFVCINDNEWQHTFESNNYVSINDLGQKDYEQIFSKNFFKISKKIEVTKWNEAFGFLEKSFRELTELININFQAGEKVP